MCYSEMIPEEMVWIKMYVHYGEMSQNLFPRTLALRVGMQQFLGEYSYRYCLISRYQAATD